MNLDAAHYQAPSVRVRPLWLLMALGVLTLLGGALVEPTRVWSNGLLVFVYLVGLGLGALFFIGAHHVAGATWTVAFRRIPEAMSGVLPAALVGVGGLVVVGIAGLHQFQFHAHHGPGDGATTFWFKELWLSPTFFVARTIVYALVWLLFAKTLLRISRAQDTDPSVAPVHRTTKLYAAFLVVFAATFSLASFDWLMALRAEWFSTIFAAYNFSGAFASALALLIILGVWARSRGVLTGAFTDDHLHDLGKLLLGFTSFWCYLWFSQYMLIWYSNIPEETLWYVPQTEGAWFPLFVFNVVLNWAVPFFVLLPKASKRSANVLVKVSVVVLIGRWLDLYLIIFPAAGATAPSFGVWEIGLAAGGAGLFGWTFMRAFRRAATVPLADPRLPASMHHHVA